MVIRQEYIEKIRPFVRCHLLDAIFFVRFSRHGLCPLFSYARVGARLPVETGP